MQPPTQTRIFLRFRSQETTTTTINTNTVFVAFNHGTTMFECFLKSATLSTKIYSVVSSIIQLNACNTVTMFNMNHNHPLHLFDEAIFEENGTQIGTQIGVEIAYSDLDLHNWCAMLRDIHIHKTNVSTSTSISTAASTISSCDQPTATTPNVEKYCMSIPIPKLRRSHYHESSYFLNNSYILFDNTDELIRGYDTILDDRYI